MITGSQCINAKCGIRILEVWHERTLPPAIADGWMCQTESGGKGLSHGTS